MSEIDSKKSKIVFKTCSRCGSRFECGAANHACACFTVVLSSKAKEVIRENYRDCLCVSCLLELSSQNPE
ncbi:cysteine-rich CWC family protein [Leptospira sp. 201903071]|uniref:cysteine-rich CWC family protein n=1 Tax=Leptospira ainazelensis TaxID=2810034 RepID=UPI001965D7A9|nr:cysteine-rich CWC family protein [Leptospira ainazelensis]